MEINRKKKRRKRKEKIGKTIISVFFFLGADTKNPPTVEVELNPTVKLGVY